MQQADFRAASYWMTTRDYLPGPPLAGDLEVDVAIIGGGFTGLSAAHHLKLAEPGLRVALLETEVIGYGASGRNGGFNMTLFGLTLSITALRFGKSQAREAHRYMELAVDTTRDLITSLGIDCDYEHPRSSSSTAAPSRGRRSRSGPWPRSRSGATCAGRIAASTPLGARRSVWA